jgi:hypothetical protein
MTPHALMTVAERIRRVEQAVASAATKAGRDPAEVTLVAVSKSVGREAVDEAHAAGIRNFGENRVADAAHKFTDQLPAGVTLHLIGQLQSNKARPAVALFDLIESVDRPSLMDALEKEAARLRRPLPVLLQVNIAAEAQKAGCAVGDAPAFAARLVASPAFDLQGLMSIAPLVDDPEAVRPVFRDLRILRDRLRDAHPSLPLDVLSMGMSNDFSVAIEEGATHVRVGRAIFGP